MSYLQVLLLLLCHGLWVASSKRTKHSGVHSRLHSNASSRSDDVWVDVVFENDTPQPMERVSVIHKFNGVTPKTHVLVWDNVGAWETTAPQRIRTAVGFWPGHFDWWVTSWRYKRVPGTWARADWVKNMGCQSCVKEDGTCETWTTSGGSFWLDLFTDPMTYIKGATMAANIVVGALTLGTSAVVGTAVAGLVTEGVAGTYLADDDTSGFYSCGIDTEDYENSLKSVPVRVRAWRTAGRAHAVQIESFERGTQDDVRSNVESVPWSNTEPPLEYRDQGSPILLAKSDTSAKGLPIFASVKSSTVIGRLHAGQRATAAGRPRDDGNGYIMVPIKPKGAVQLKFFDIWKSENGACQSWSNKALPCRSYDVQKQGSSVSVRIHNAGAKNIKKLVLAHKHNGLEPRVHMRVFGPVAPAGVSQPQDIQTLSGFGFRADWWLLAWQEAEHECIVKSTVSPGFFKKLVSDPTEPLISASAAVLEKLLHTNWIGHVLDAGFHAGSKVNSSGSYAGVLGSSVEDILGIQLVHLLAKNSDTTGFVKCSLGAQDLLRSEAGNPLEIHVGNKTSPSDSVSIHSAGGPCVANVLFMRCLQTEACAHTEACKVLKEGSVELAAVAERLGVGGALMALNKAVDAALNTVVK